ncbi:MULTISPECIES: hypothetical protein [unclassified Bradyrhizobium]|uniref:hypothetical protein n=1 Tax=unclassified Bradyrhizobium TaxID=2631580 RepID=UPI0028E38BE8|nr:MULTISPECIES: hypothetical protein [unclassified Bradyrhizobium]
MSDFLIAWLASSAAFSIAFVAFMIFWAGLDGVYPGLKGISRLAGVTIGSALALQLVYGGLVYLLLTRIGVWRLWAVTLAYLILWVLAWNSIDTSREAWGMLAWLVFACLVAWVFWFVAK